MRLAGIGDLTQNLTRVAQQMVPMFGDAVEALNELGRAMAQIRIETAVLDDKAQSQPDSQPQATQSEFEANQGNVATLSDG